MNRPNNFARLSVIFALFIIFSYTGCSEDPTSPGETVQADNDIDIRIGSFKAIKDCDGIEGSGEFSFEVHILDKNGDKISSYSKGNITLSSGSSISINKTLSVKLKRETGSRFTVRFICNEWDKNIFGKVYKDSRMSSKTVSFTHEYNSGGNWNDITGKRKLTTNPGSDCSTEVDYTVAVL